MSAGLIVAALELGQVFEQNQPLRIGLGCCLNERLGDSGFAEWRRSAEIYRKIIAADGATPELLEKYGQLPRTTMANRTAQFTKI